MTASSLDENRMTDLEPSGVTGTLAAGALLMTSAMLTFIVGVFALAADDLVVSGPGHVYTFQLSGWGWANILTGVVLAVVAFALFLKAPWARTVAIIVTCLAIVVSFLWMPYYPVGSVVLIAIDVVVIWGVATWNTSRKTA